jgi:hypothetical protein
MPVLVMSAHPFKHVCHCAAQARYMKTQESEPNNGKRQFHGTPQRAFNAL